MDKKFTHEAIFCIVNSGYSEAVMDAAKKFGASGGTVLSARGTANKDAESFFGISIQPEKELVMIVVTTALKDKILGALYDEVGLNSPGQGIAFSLPVDGTVGLHSAQVSDKKAPVQTSIFKSETENK